MSPRHDPHTTTPTERRRLLLGQWLARAAFVLAIVGAVLVSYPYLLNF